jgi:hypothetical protein
MKILISILLIFFLRVSNAYSQDISGYWQGVIYQPANTTTPTYFPYRMVLTQNGNVITGTVSFPKSWPFKIRE